MKAFSMEAFQRIPLIGILRGQQEDAMNGIIGACQGSGITTIEITLNTPNALDIISSLVSRFGGKLNIGAGTVCSTADLGKALEAGAQFIVSPILDIPLVLQCKKMGIPVFPGAYSPTEIYKAWEAGATMVKIFPAMQLGADYISQLKAPLDDIKLLPTGGIDLDNMQQFMLAGADGFGLASALFDQNLIAAEDWTGLEHHLGKYVNLWKQGK
jgi:2-dehydro-3-deoxyphosphogluconate aldolase/(4S)-4-hydroxy-2-oxoglutarate aldolase